MKKELELVPRAVVCRRSADVYDGELVFNHVHYVVAMQCPTHEAAKAATKKVCGKLIRKLKHVGVIFLAPYPKAKP